MVDILCFIASYAIALLRDLILIFGVMVLVVVAIIAVGFVVKFILYVLDRYTGN